MKKIIILIITIFLFSNVLIAQKLAITPYNIGERIPDIQFSKVVNYKNDSLSFGSFEGKLIILDFWHTHCGSCIAMFPLEDSIQNEFKDQLQIILVTAESSDIVDEFLKKRSNDIHKFLNLPVITSDILLNKMFLHSYNPHYVWIAPNGEIVAFSSALCISRQSIKGVLTSVKGDMEIMKMKHYSNDFINYPKIDKLQSEYLNLHNH